MKSRSIVCSFTERHRGYIDKICERELSEDAAHLMHTFATPGLMLALSVRCSVAVVGGHETSR